MVEDLLTQLAQSVWALPALFALVFADAFLVIVPGEAAVTAFGALAVSQGRPLLWTVIVIAAIGAVCGDALCYLVGRTIGLERWRWMRRPRVRAAFAWAEVRLRRRAALVLFTARFIPFARLAVNLTAGATRIPAPRYLAVAAVAALAWASYQALIGAVVAAFLPGGPVAAVVVSVVLAVGLGLAIDAVLARRLRGQDAERDPIGVSASLPGHISPESLELVIADVLVEGPCSVAETARRLSMSPVMARRHLEHLVDSGRVERTARYGAAGSFEPEYRWRSGG